jgi:hypothetical protein
MMGKFLNLTNPKFIYSCSSFEAGKEKYVSYANAALNSRSIDGSLQPLHSTAYNLTLQLGH